MVHWEPPLASSYSEDRHSLGIGSDEWIGGAKLMEYVDMLIDINNLSFTLNF